MSSIFKIWNSLKIFYRIDSYEKGENCFASDRGVYWARPKLNPKIHQLVVRGNLKELWYVINIFQLKTFIKKSMDSIRISMNRCSDYTYTIVKVVDRETGFIYPLE